MKNITKAGMQKLEALRTAAQEAMDALKIELEQLADQADEYYQDRSDKWQESENGQMYAEWSDAIREVSYAADSVINDIESIDFDEIKEPNRE